MPPNSGTHAHQFLGKWTPGSLDLLLRRAAESGDLSARIEFISRQFLGIPYGSHTLIGSPDVAEALVINLEAVDCFTYLDYVEAMRLSSSYAEFITNLTDVRYRSGVVAYGTRRHFFTDWIGSKKVKAVTGEIGGTRTKGVSKTLNVKSDGSCFLPGIPPVDRTIYFLPSSAAQTAIADLRTGDYVGIYTEVDGLDVSHVGIVVRNGDSVNLRHASSVHSRVVEVDFREYQKDKPGLIVLRPQA
jgi:hypothetical protein